MPYGNLFFLTVVISLGLSGLVSNAASEGGYLGLTARQNRATPFESVRLTRGPQEKVARFAGTWLQMELREKAQYDQPPLCTIRCLAEGDPLVGRTNPVRVLRYQVRFPATGECLEYRDRYTGLALLPTWADFLRHFLPRAAPGSGLAKGLPESVELLGHVWTQHYATTNASWVEWTDVKVLALDGELLIGNSRPFKDCEGHRLPQIPERQNYQYVPYTAEDLRAMMDAGFNLFTLNPEQVAWVRSEPVFYHRRTEGKPPLNYPADLYRANYLGPVMFMDEPSIIMVGDTNVHRTLRYFSDAAALIEKRTRVTYEMAGSYGSYLLEKNLESLGVNLGDMRVRQVDYPSWETLYETTFYQMRGGGAGLVHEGRYQVESFNQTVAKFTGRERRHTPGEVLQYHYAFLRGGTRPFGKHWGTAIYGQCDTNVSPLALTLAYDMGARYLWFWSSDHDHHVPWVEQLELCRHLRAHERAHPRGSIFARPIQGEVAITIPDGYFISLDNLWWVRAMDRDGKNEASQRYRRLMQRALAAVHQCFDRGWSFDITVNDGRKIIGYRKIIPVDDRPD